MSGQSPCQYDVVPGHPVVAVVNHPGMSEAFIGAVGRPSKPAPLRCSWKSTPRESSTDPQCRLLARIAFGLHGPNLSSLSRSSPSEATRCNSQAETDPQVQQESPISAPMGGRQTAQNAGHGRGGAVLKMLRGMCMETTQLGASTTSLICRLPATLQIR